MVTTTHHLILPAGLFVTKVLPIPHNQEQALITIVTRAELGRGTYVEALPFVFRGASSRWGERGATALLSGATEMLCLWRRSFGGATPVTASPIVSQLRHFFSEFPALTMTMTLFAAGDLVADLRAGAPSCVINCSVTHYILLQKDGFNFFVN